MGKPRRPETGPASKVAPFRSRGDEELEYCPDRLPGYLALPPRSCSGGPARADRTTRPLKDLRTKVSSASVIPLKLRGLLTAGARRNRCRQRRRRRRIERRTVARSWPGSCPRPSPGRDRAIFHFLRRCAIGGPGQRIEVARPQLLQPNAQKSVRAAPTDDLASHAMRTAPGAATRSDAGRSQHVLLTAMLALLRPRSSPRPRPRSPPQAPRSPPRAAPSFIPEIADRPSRKILSLHRDRSLDPTHLKQTYSQRYKSPRFRSARVSTYSTTSVFVEATVLKNSVFQAADATGRSRQAPRSLKSGRRPGDRCSAIPRRLIGRRRVVLRPGSHWACARLTSQECGKFATRCWRNSRPATRSRQADSASDGLGGSARLPWSRNDGRMLLNRPGRISVLCRERRAGRQRGDETRGIELFMPGD